ncbi:MAG: hypothetical protein ABSC93_09030 [Bryobacteraceae bacterium]|jgi:imidazolonepropionase-like amidohydrolase
MPVLIFIFTACLLQTQEHAVETSISHVAVIHMAMGEELKDQTVTLRGNRIAPVAPAQPGDESRPGAIDAHGQYLIPGLWDMHVHVHDTADLPLYIANGFPDSACMMRPPSTP